MANVISINSLEELCRKRGGNISYHSEKTGGLSWLVGSGNCAQENPVGVLL